MCFSEEPSKTSMQLVFTWQSHSKKVQWLCHLKLSSDQNQLCLLKLKMAFWEEKKKRYISQVTATAKKKIPLNWNQFGEKPCKTMPSRWTVFDLFIPKASLVSIFICLQTFLITRELHSSCSAFYAEDLPRQSWPQDLGLLNHSDQAQTAVLGKHSFHGSISTEQLQ